MKKAGEASPAVEAQFSTQITIHEFWVSVNQNFQTLVDQFPVSPSSDQNNRNGHLVTNMELGMVRWNS
jgi:hypothetical protein